MGFGFAYTWPHTIDDANDPLVAAGAGGRSFPRNFYNLREERGNSGTDVRHRAVLHYTLELGNADGTTGVRQMQFARRLIF